ncbi:MAG: HAMP domain-containing protein [Anaerolineaceae bacterium]|nr:HAMP domain-containing protein [Anaerolineaceae bacterium]
MNALRTWVSELGLWPRVGLAISAGFFGLLFAFAFLGELALEESGERILEERLAITQLAAQQIDNWLLEEAGELKQASLTLELDVNDPGLDLKVKQLAESFQQLDEFPAGFFFVNETGTVVLSYPAELYPTGTNLSTVPHIQLALAQGEPIISEPYRDPLTGKPVAALGVPLISNAQVSGLLLGQIELEDERIIMPLRKAASLGQTAHGALFDNQGRVLVTTFGLPFLSMGEHHTFYREALTAGEPVVATVPFELELPNEPEGHKHVMAFAPLQFAPWGVAIGGDALGETFTGLQQLRIGLMVLAVLAFSGAWGLTMFSGRHLIRPLQTLTLSAQNVARGELNSPIPTDGVGEVGALAFALENMRLQLAENIRQLTDWNDALEGRIQEKTEDLIRQQELTQQLLRRVISAQEEERGRIARELHDNFGQTLSTIELSMNRVAKALPAEDDDAHERLDQARTLVEQAVVELRQVIQDMRPHILDKLGLVPALGWISKQTLRPRGIEVTIEADGRITSRLPSEIEIVLFRIAQEAINNVIQHSQAQHVTILLRQSDNHISLLFSDNGRGWDMRPNEFKDMSRGLGLVGMQERAALVGGQVHITSSVTRGTTIQVQIPWHRLEDNGENGGKHEPLNSLAHS